MIPSLAPTRIESHAAYRRQARRIRAAVALAPATRIRALRELARRYDATRREGEVPAKPRFSPRSASTAWLEPRPPLYAADFAEVVRNRMEGPILRYSHRTRLLREAARRGMGRFEANLVIAAVQHQAGMKRTVESVTSRSSWMSVILGVGATQCAIVTGLWWMMR